jgi:Leucine-rich repeat (LRR) protein
MKYLKKYEQQGEMTFKEWLKNNPKDINTRNIDCRNSKLIDLDGIQEFINLIELHCPNNKLTELPDLSNLTNLQTLSVYDNKLAKLPDLSNLTKLINLYCDDNNLTELPDLTELTQLEDLYCYGNKLPFKCTRSKNNLKEYFKWHKKEYPWFWDTKNYNL